LSNKENIIDTYRLITDFIVLILTVVIATLVSA